MWWLIAGGGLYVAIMFLVGFACSMSDNPEAVPPLWQIILWPILLIIGKPE